MTAGNAGTDPLAEALWLHDGYDLNADPGSSTDRDLRPHYVSLANVARAHFAALLADETNVEKVAEALGGGASTTFPRLYRGRARAALAAIAGLLDEAAGR